MQEHREESDRHLEAPHVAQSRYLVRNRRRTLPERRRRVVMPVQRIPQYLIQSLPSILVLLVRVPLVDVVVVLLVAPFRLGLLPLLLSPLCYQGIHRCRRRFYIVLIDPVVGAQEPIPLVLRTAVCPAEAEHPRRCGNPPPMRHHQSDVQ